MSSALYVCSELHRCSTQNRGPTRACPECRSEGRYRIAYRQGPGDALERPCGCLLRRVRHGVEARYLLFVPCRKHRRRAPK